MELARDTFETEYMYIQARFMQGTYQEHEEYVGGMFGTYLAHERHLLGTCWERARNLLGERQKHEREL